MRCSVLPALIPVPLSAEWIDDDELAARLERRKEPLIHLRAIDGQVRDVVIVVDDGDQIELRRLVGDRILERPRNDDEIRLRMIGHSLRQRGARLRRLRPYLAAGSNRERQQLRRVTRPGRNIQDLHTRPGPA
jgi:hypothetical protein